MDMELFHKWQESALVRNIQNTGRQQGLAVPPIQKPYPANAALVALPEPDFLDDHQVSFLELMELRASVREYSDKPLTLKELSYLLWCTQGVKMVLNGGVTKRTVPSAGGRNALETYLYIDKVEGVEPGLYRFLPLEHALLPLAVGAEVKEKLAQGFSNVHMYNGAAVTFMWSAVLARMEYCYGGRAFQYIFLDAGHVCQNLYLAAYTLGVGTCAIGHYKDEELNGLLALDGEREFMVYAAHVGKVR